MAKMNPLQEQLLKAGLAKKARLTEITREHGKARQAKAPTDASEIAQSAERARAEKAERDRALAAGQKQQRLAAELRAQARQIIDDKKVPSAGTSEYRFTVYGAIRTLLVDELQRKHLASGALLIVRRGDGFALLPRVAGDKVRERDASLIVLDHRSAAAPSTQTSEDDAYYAQFTVPDDLVW